MHALDGGFDALLLDRMLPDLDGLSLLKSLRAAGVQTPAILLTAMSAIDERVTGLRAGADDYVVKPFSFAELSARLEAILRRPAETRPEQTRLACADLELDLIARTARRGERRIELLPREFQMLEYLMRRQDRVVTRTMLLEGLWDYRFDPGTNVIDVHISRLRRKIDAEGERAADPHRPRQPATSSPPRPEHAPLRHHAADPRPPRAARGADRPGPRLALLARRRRHRRRAARRRRGRDARLHRRLRPRRHPGARRRHRPPAAPARPTATPSTCSPTPTGARIAGNLGRWPPTVAPDAGWATLSLYRTDRDRADRDLRARPAPARRRAAARRPRRRRPRRLRPRPRPRRCSGRWPRSPLLALATGWFLARLIRGPDRRDRRRRPRRSWPAPSTAACATRGTGDEFDRLAATLNAMLDRIEALVRDLRMVTDSLAHDLRSPLGRLVRELEAGRRRDRHPDARRARIERALREAEGRARHRHRALRHHPDRGRHRRRAVRPRRPRPRRRRRRRALRGRRRGARPELAATAEPGLVVDGHVQLLALALSNLVDNALRHAPAGRRTSPSPPARRRRARRSSSPTAAPASPRPTASRALERFVRLDPSRGGPGAGLGLALVAAVARLHGATVVLADNAPGLVATLRFETPHAARACPPGTAAATARSSAGTRW